MMGIKQLARGALRLEGIDGMGWDGDNWIGMLC